MILGIGTDIIKVERIRSIYKEKDDPFIIKTFTVKEREEAMERDDPALYLASRFAGKEAVFKCLGIGGDNIRLNEIQILGSETGQPYVVLSGEIKAAAEKKSVRNILLSLSYEDDYAVAFAMAQD